ncbi:MAG: 30S ribosome-binding factor RbfA [Candidatus Brocadiae bacterium]|nr:30S ribosome-binding factor RbfA [Candidatus Brocadiia bacterium]
MDPRKKRRIEELLRRELSNIVLHELRDPRAGFVTVTAVELSGDQRSAKVLVMVRGSEEEKGEALRTLSRARGHIQGLVGDRLELRYTPVLRFAEDTELHTVRRVEKLIDEARRQDREYREIP